LEVLFFRKFETDKTIKH